MVDFSTHLVSEYAKLVQPQRGVSLSGVFNTPRGYALARVAGMSHQRLVAKCFETTTRGVSLRKVYTFASCASSLCHHGVIPLCGDATRASCAWFLVG